MPLAESRSGLESTAALLWAAGQSPPRPLHKQRVSCGCANFPRLPGSGLGTKWVPWTPPPPPKCQDPCLSTTSWGTAFERQPQAAFNVDENHLLQPRPPVRGASVHVPRQLEACDPGSRAAGQGARCDWQAGPACCGEQGKAPGGAKVAGEGSCGDRCLGRLGPSQEGSKCMEPKSRIGKPTVTCRRTLTCSAHACPAGRGDRSRPQTAPDRRPRVCRGSCALRPGPARPGLSLAESAERWALCGVRREPVTLTPAGAPHLRPGPAGRQTRGEAGTHLSRWLW